MIRNLWPNTRRDWATVALVVLTFFALDALALMGSDLASDLLVCVAGMLGGTAVAYVATYPLRARFGGSGLWRLLGAFLGLGLVFGIIFAGSALADIPAFPTAESGNIGNLIYGFAFGFGVYVPKGLGLSGGPGPSPGAPRSYGTDLRVVAVALGAVAGLFGVLFALYVLIEFVAAPLIRYFAA